MDVEQLLIDSMVRGSPAFRQAVEALVEQLLAEAGYSGWYSDGVHFEWEEVEQDRARGTGTIIMLETQESEPLRVEFLLDDSREKIASGLIHFGDARARDAGSRSRDHHRLVKRILSDPAVEFRWIERFRRDADGWRRVTSGPSRSA